MNGFFNWLWENLSHPKLRRDSEELFWVNVRNQQACNWCTVEFPEHVLLAEWVRTGKHPEPYSETEYVRFATISEMRDLLRQQTKLKASCTNNKSNR